jgi:hypothetical protein
MDAWEFFKEHSRDFPVAASEPAMYAVLRQRGRPVSAAVMELFGSDLAHIKYVVTDARLRKRGHYSRLHRWVVWLEDES